jgi:hypothetical protein
MANRKLDCGQSADERRDLGAPRFRKNKRREKTRVEIKHALLALPPFVSHLAQYFRARLLPRRQRGAKRG